VDNKIKAYGICLYKKESKETKILLCKSVSSHSKWGCLKGCMEENETKEQTAIREFYEECSIKVDKKYFETYFEQINDTKDIGIFLVNSKNIDNLENYFDNNKLKFQYLSWENSKVCFFDIKKLPIIKQKQYKIIESITNYLQRD